MANQPIKMTPCSSSRICSHGHDPATNTLALQFKRKNPDGGEPIGGQVYHYAGFTADDYKALTEAESLGKHFGTVINVKNDNGTLKYPFTKIEAEPENHGEPQP